MLDLVQILTHPILGVTWGPMGHTSLSFADQRQR